MILVSEACVFDIIVKEIMLPTNIGIRTSEVDRINRLWGNHTIVKDIITES